MFTLTIQYLLAHPEAAALYCTRGEDPDEDADDRAALEDFLVDAAEAGEQELFDADEDVASIEIPTDPRSLSLHPSSVSLADICSDGFANVLLFPTKR